MELSGILFVQQVKSGTIIALAGKKKLAALKRTLNAIGLSYKEDGRENVMNEEEDYVGVISAYRVVIQSPDLPSYFPNLLASEVHYGESPSIH